jgi:hypothetical protein
MANGNPETIQPSATFATTDSGADTSNIGHIVAGICERAFVYCPGKSKCFTDPIFNVGNIPVPGPNEASAWGWSISNDFITSNGSPVTDCEVWIGANDCDFSSATKVGRFEYGADYAHFCLDEYGYQGHYYNVYMGKCEGNDGGKSSWDGQCDTADIKENARKPFSYPLIHKEDGPASPRFTFDLRNYSDYITHERWKDYVPPKDGVGYISGHACVSKLMYDKSGYSSEGDESILTSSPSPSSSSFTPPVNVPVTVVTTTNTAAPVDGAASIATGNWPWPNGERRLRRLVSFLNK